MLYQILSSIVKVILKFHKKKCKSCSTFCDIFNHPKQLKSFNYGNSTFLFRDSHSFENNQRQIFDLDAYQVDSKMID